MSNSLVYSIPEVCKILGFGKTKIYECINSGELKAKKWGRKTVILKSSLEDFLSNLEDYSTSEEVDHA